MVFGEGGVKAEQRKLPGVGERRIRRLAGRLAPFRYDDYHRGKRDRVAGPQGVFGDLCGVFG
jgi:hypothetical protein